MKPTQLFSSGEAAAMLGVPRWRLLYLIDRGELPRPNQIVAGRRLFTHDDVAAMQAALDVRAARSEHILPESS